jgi:molybdopterin synthase sulfur carrier subunit
MPLLMARSAGHALALKNMAAVRVAVNRSYGDLKTAVAAGDEIAFFPPVTGG